MLQTLSPAVLGRDARVHRHLQGAILMIMVLLVPAMANPNPWSLSIEYGGGTLGQVALHHHLGASRFSLGAGGGIDFGKQDVAGEQQDGLLWTAFGHLDWQFLKAPPIAMGLYVRGGFTSLSVSAGGVQSWYVAPGLTLSVWHVYASVSVVGLLSSPEVSWVPQVGLGLQISFGEEAK